MKELFLKIKAYFKEIIDLILAPLIFISKKLILPGFKGVPLYDVIVFFIRGMQKSSVMLRANALAFTFIMAFVPAVLFFFNLIPYIPISGLRDNIMLTLQQALPTEAFLTVKTTIEDIITRQRGGLVSFSFLISIYFASDGIIGIMNSFNQSSHSVETRSAVQKRLISLLLVFLLSIVLIISSAVLALSSLVINYFDMHHIIQGTFAIFLLGIGKWAIIILMVLSGFSLIYYLAPAKRGSFPFFSAGSIFGTFLSLVSFLGFSFFIDNFGTYNKFYGSMGTIIVINVWVNLNALSLLIGYELNASIYSARRYFRKNGPAGD